MTSGAAQGFDKQDFRAALGSFATGVTVVTAQTPDGRMAGVTCNSFASVSLEPPLVLWSLLLQSSSIEVFEQATHFAVNVLCVDQRMLAMKFSRSSEDKFSGVQLLPGFAGAPLIAGCKAHFHCRKADRYYGGDHAIYLGAVEHYRYVDAEPLLFANGRFRTLLSEPL